MAAAAHKPACMPPKAQPFVEVFLKHANPVLHTWNFHIYQKKGHKNKSESELSRKVQT